MDYPIHRFRHKIRAIAIDLRVRMRENARLVVDDSGFEFINLYRMVEVV